MHLALALNLAIDDLLLKVRPLSSPFQSFLVDVENGRLIWTIYETCRLFNEQMRSSLIFSVKYSNLYAGPDRNSRVAVSVVTDK